MTRRPDLIVPIRDRRAHKRILTLKTARRAAIAVIIFLAGLTINSNLQRRPAGEYGRLYDKRMPAVPATMAPQPMPVVQEAPPAVSAPDPMLATPVATDAKAETKAAAPAPVAASVVTGTSDGKGVAIVGGPEGVTIVRGGSQSARPRLSGGVFRESQ